MRLTFLGAAQEVTGSCFLVETDGVRFLVDCGMFQGGSEARERNLKAWPFDPRQIDFVQPTHAHIDHSDCRLSGSMPKDGYWPTAGGHQRQLRRCGR